MAAVTVRNLFRKNPIARSNGSRFSADVVPRRKSGKFWRRRYAPRGASKSDQNSPLLGSALGTVISTSPAIRYRLSQQCSNDRSGYERRLGLMKRNGSPSMWPRLMSARRLIATEQGGRGAPAI